MIFVNDLGFLNSLLEILIWSVWMDPTNLYFLRSCWVTFYKQASVGNAGLNIQWVLWKPIICGLRTVLGSVDSQCKKQPQSLLPSSYSV